MDVNEELEFGENSQKKTIQGGGSGGGVGLVWGSAWDRQGGRERRIEVFVKIQKKKKNCWGGGGGGGWVVGGGGSGWM